MQSTVQQNQGIQQPKPAVQIQPQVQTQPQVQVQSQASQNYMTPPIIQQPAAQTYYAPQAIQSPQSPSGTASNSPNYAGVNIQIFNPSVTTPGAAAPVYNVNAPSYQTGQQAPTGCYPSNYYTKPLATTDSKPAEKTEEKSEDKKKTEKRSIVQLTDEYIKTLENYLNSQDKEVRMMGAKEVVARLQEDDSRKDDLALNALVNKMLQDPYQGVKMLALGVLDSRQCTGNDYTVGVLQNMQKGDSGYGQDAKTATNILLKMSGKTIEKEFEVKDKPKKEEDKK